MPIVALLAVRASRTVTTAGTMIIPLNPLTMGPGGFEVGTAQTATTGGQALLDGMMIDSPEAVVAHMEAVQFPRMRGELQQYDQRFEGERVREIVAAERTVQDAFGRDLLKVPYGIVRFPLLRYVEYGYVPYFSAYALYPEIIAQDFTLQADLAVHYNRAAARAYREGGLPPLLRADHDMADSRGTLVSPRSLARLWFPQFARSMAPVLEAGVRVIWHCDGNLMQLVRRLLEVGLQGFQGLQYEDGMDYETICAGHHTACGTPVPLPRWRTEWPGPASAHPAASAVAVPVCARLAAAGMLAIAWTCGTTPMCTNRVTTAERRAKWVARLGGQAAGVRGGLWG
jgi:hypothetical protein